MESVLLVPHTAAPNIKQELLNPAEELSAAKCCFRLMAKEQAQPSKMHIFLQHGLCECLVWGFSSVMLRVCGVSVPEPILQLPLQVMERHGLFQCLTHLTYFICLSSSEMNHSL